LWLVADNRNDLLIELTNPRGNIRERRPGLELASRFDAVQIVLAANDLRRLVRAYERARDKKINARDDLVEPARGALHLANALGRQRTLRVVTSGGRKDLSVFGNCMSNDEQFHESGYGFFSTRALIAAGISNDAGSAAS
jgi:hypothetical protein